MSVVKLTFTTVSLPYRAVCISLIQAPRLGKLEECNSSCSKSFFICFYFFSLSQDAETVIAYVPKKLNLDPPIPLHESTLTVSWLRYGQAEGYVMYLVVFNLCRVESSH